MARRRSIGSNDSQRILRDLLHQRHTLAGYLARQNPTLSAGDVAESSSDLILRLLFLRMCEDRGIETGGRLCESIEATKVHPHLVDHFRRCEKRFGTGLFDCRPDQNTPRTAGRSWPDLTIDNPVLRDIIQSWITPEYTGAFSTLPVDLLGWLHEAFLGRTCRLNGDRQIVIQGRSKSKKTTGIYYTPRPIVHEIVVHTVGKLLDGKTPKQAARLRILDPACGCGAFLLGAYRYLLDWHLHYYLNHDPARWARGVHDPIGRRRNPLPARRDETRNSKSFCLTVREKLRILTDNLYGIDLDHRAVSLTRGALLLAALENEELDGADSSLADMQGVPPSHSVSYRIPVDLSKNIRCGNALIGPDIFDGEPGIESSPETRFRIRAFDWRAAFPHVFGKPSHQSRARKEADKRNITNKRGPLPHVRGSDCGSDCGGFDAVIGNPPYLSFSGRQSVKLSDRERAYFAEHYQSAGWITSHGLFIERAIKDLSRRFTAFVVPDQVGHLDGYRSVRKTINRHAGLAEVRYWGEGMFDEAVTPTLTFVADRSHHGPTIIHQPGDGPITRILCESGEAWTNSANRTILARLRHHAYSLGDCVADPGVHTGNCSRKLIVSDDLSGTACVPVLEGRLVSRYRCKPPTKHLRLDYRPAPGEYFTLRERDRYRDAPFVIRQTAAYPIVGPREHADYFRNTLLALYPPKDGTDTRYLVGLLNSRLIRYVYRQTVRESRQKAFPQVKVGSLRALPIRKIDPRNAADLARHDQIVEQVQRMLDLHRRLATATDPTEASALRRRIDEADLRIDRRVDELYGLTDAEIAVVEEETQG